MKHHQGNTTCQIVNRERKHCMQSHHPTPGRIRMMSCYDTHTQKWFVKWLINDLGDYTLQIADIHGDCRTSNCTTVPHEFVCSLDKNKCAEITWSINLYNKNQSPNLHHLHHVNSSRASNISVNDIEFTLQDRYSQYICASPGGLNWLFPKNFNNSDIDTEYFSRCKWHLIC